jgi:hypothetical protein
MGTSQLLSVPYAMTSGDLAGTVDKLSVKGTTSGLEEALFEVKNKDGQTVFAVYNEGVRVYVSNGAKAVKGGFAVGGFGTDKAESTKYLFVGKDSVRIYLDNNPLTKGTKTGFAVGGYDLTKGVTQNFLDVSADSTRIYVKNQGKGIKGGFAVGGFDATKAPASPFMSLDRSNYYIGHKSGVKNTTGLYNSVLGYEAGLNNTEGFDNVFLGYQSGYSNTVGRYNVFLGFKAGYSTVGEIQTTPWLIEYGSCNVFIGTESGFSNVSGFANVFLGNNSGYYNISGTDNTFIGHCAGEENSDGLGNLYLGGFAGRHNLSGWYNVNVGFYSGNKNTQNGNTFLGAYAGENNILGQNNTFAGNGAGMNSTGSSNVFVGFQAGANETGNGRLYIANSSTNSPLIYGNFSAGTVGLGTTAPTQTLDVNGNARFRSIGSDAFAYNLSITTDGTLTTATSDISMKENIEQISNALESVTKLRGVYFSWKNDPVSVKQMGMIAQEVATVIPEMVFTNPVDGLKGINYAQTSALFVEAIKEQQQQIESQQKEIEELKMMMMEMKNEIASLSR